MARFWRYFVPTLLLAAAAAGLWVLYTTEQGAAPRRKRPPVPVTVAVVRAGEIVERIDAIGTLQARESITVTAKVTEIVTEIRFTDGQAVRKGDILAVLSQREQMALLAKAQADLKAADSQAARIARLARSGTASAARLEQVTARRQALLAEIQAIKARIADRVIRAPFAGIVGLRRISPGTLIQPGTAITTLDDISEVKADFSVPESFITAVAPKQEIHGRVAAYAERRFAGRITAVGSRVNPATRAVQVRAVLPNRDLTLKPGMLVTVAVIKARRTALVIPEESIVPIRDRHYVYVVGADRRAQRVEIRIGLRQPGRVEVRAGLKAGQRVIVEGTMRVRPGSRVRLPRPRSGRRPTAGRT